jgi:hypothetical protein
MPMLFEVQDHHGDVWTSLHLRCIGTMLPAYNTAAVPRPAWWWWCQVCQRFVRPLSQQESMIMEHAVAQQPSRSKKQAQRRR